MNVQFLNACAEPWLAAIARASWQGGLSLTIAWLLCRVFPKLPPAWQCWIWRLVCLKFFMALFWVTPIDLPVLPASDFPGPPAAIAMELDPGSPTMSPPRSTFYDQTSSPGTSRLTPAGWVFLAWLAGVGLCGLRLIRLHRVALSLRRACQPLQDANLTIRSAELSRQFHLRKPPFLRVAPLLFSPLITGITRPMIILPSRLLTDRARLDLMLAHELAHLERHDLWWAWLPAILKSLFFFHPLVWLADKEWRLSQELACDELAMRRANAPVGEYAEMLLALAAQTASPLKKQPLPFTAPIAETKHSLIRRISAIKHIVGYSRKKSVLAGVAVLVFGLGTIAPWCLVARAADQPANGSEPDRPATSQRSGLASAEMENLLRELDAARAKIAGLESQLFDLRTSENKSIKAEAGARLSAVRRVEWQRAQMDMQHAESQFKRKKELFQGHLISAEEFEKAEHELAKARVELETARARVEVVGAMARAREEAAAGELVAAVPAPISNAPQERKRARQLELLREEIKLVDQEVSLLQKQFESGRGTAEGLRMAQRELFGLKRELAARESRPAEIRSLMEQELKVIEQQLKEFQKRIEVGAWPVGGDLSWKRALLKLKRELEALD